MILLLITLLLMTSSSGALFFRSIFFRRIFFRCFKLQYKFLCSLTCSIRTSMNKTLIMVLYTWTKFSITNWQFLIPCYHQNLERWFCETPFVPTYNSTASYYFSQFKWGENTPHYDKPHIPHLEIIHVSSYNQIKLSTKDLPSIWS